jgi:hypothetical protein
MATKHHTLLWIIGIGGAGWAGYEYIYKPWAAQQAANALLAAGGTLPATTAAPTSLLPSLTLPSPLSMITEPTALPTPSIGTNPGGAVGACMTAKGGTWTQSQCQTRLDALTQAAQNAMAALAQLQAGTPNPAAAGIPAAQAQLEAEQAALATATDSYNQLVAAGNTNGAATFKAAMDAHTADINDLTARIAAAQVPVNNTAAIAAYQGALAANQQDYANLTGGMGIPIAA